METGYYKPQLMLPAPLPTQELNPVTPMPAYPRPSFMGQAQNMAGPGVSNGIYAQPGNQGELTRLAYQMAGAPPQPPPHPASTTNGAPLLPMTDPSGILTGASSSGGQVENNKFKGTESGALMGAQYGGWPGAIVGGAAGYLANGGFPDANPIKASGFSGINMDQAWQDQNLARLASNPAASVASKLGVSSDSVLGKVLDPASMFSGHKGSHWRNWDAFNQAFPGTTVNGEGNYVLPDGTTVNQSQLDNLAGTWYGATYAPDGNQADWQQKWQQALTDTGAQPIFFGG